MNLKFLLPALCLLFAAGLTIVSAQSTKSITNKSPFPTQAKDVTGFVPPRWRLDEDSRVTGDLNGDSIPDYAFILIRESPALTGVPSESDEELQALIVAFGSLDGTLRRAAVAAHLLPCARCYGQIGEGGLFFEKGTLLVEQSSGGSGDTFAKASYRFKYDPAAKKFFLTGTEFLNACPVGGMHEDNSESTNLVTGARTTILRAGKRRITRKTRVAKTKISLEEIDHDRQEEAGFERIQCR